MSRDNEKSNIDSLIDANLKRVYETVLNEDIPDRFADLLDKLKAGEGAPAPDGSADGAED